VIEIDIPEVLAELVAMFETYERALVANEIESVNRLFWVNPSTVRYGTREYEQHYGHMEIATFRIKRGAVNRPRVLKNTRITTFGHDFGIANTEFLTPGSDKIGRQSQTWVRTDEGWRIAGAHVSFGV
jgi:hypothetical protein